MAALTVNDHEEGFGYFPLIIAYSDAKDRPVIVDDPSEIESSRSFRVLKTQYEIHADMNK